MDAAEGVVQSGLSVVADVNGIAVHLQQVPESAGQPDLVFNHQYAHEAPPYVMSSPLAATRISGSRAAVGRE